jgi:hypothetical protein
MKKYAAITALLMVSLLMFSCGSGPAGPTGSTSYTMRFQNGVYPSASYAGSADTYLDSIASGTNYSAAAAIWMGYYPGEIEHYTVRYDLSSVIPSNINVKKAYLTIKCSSIGGAMSNTYTAYALAVNDITTETWNDSATATPWTTAGGDFGAAAKSNSVMISSAGVYVFSLDTAMVKSWITSPAANYGILIKGASEAGARAEAVIYTSDDGVIADRPMLTIEYTLP